ncbi:hypothetical protein FRC01_008711 [Tulasnella sp. 417]|nr:hypothetical protein FRC01_008711 [Tulasnella sp. 417]
MQRGKEKTEDAVECEERLKRCTSRHLRHRVSRHGGAAEEENLDLMRANFEPEATSEDLEREERLLTVQEEVAAVATFSFPAVPPKSPIEPPVEPPVGPELEASPTPEPEPEEEEEAAPAPSVADDQTFITDDTLATEPSSPGQQHPQEFGEFVIGQRGGVGVAWTESDGLPFHQLHADEHPLSPSDDELMDYGAEYAASRRPRKSTALMGIESASGSDRLERLSNGSGTSRARAHMVSPPTSTFGSSRKPTILHWATGSGTLSSHSGLSGQGGQVYYQPVAPVQFQAPVPAEPADFDGVPGGLDDLEPPPSAGFSHQ